MQELRWHEIKEAKGYFVSDNGLVKGRRGNLLRLPKNKKGYYQFAMPIKELGKTISILVHRLVAEYFVYGDRSLQVNHIDGNKLNNHYTNLEYLSCKENIAHAIRTGLRTASINLKSKSMFSNNHVRIIKECFERGFGNQDISKYYKCSDSTISKIRRGAHYKNVSV